MKGIRFWFHFQGTYSRERRTSNSFYALMPAFLFWFQFNLSPQTMPLYFLIMGSAFTVGVQLTSRLVKYGVPTKTLMITGCIFVIQSFAFLGPAPFIPFKAYVLNIKNYYFSLNKKLLFRRRNLRSNGVLHSTYSKPIWIIFILVYSSKNSTQIE